MSKHAHLARIVTVAIAAATVVVCGGALSAQHLNSKPPSAGAAASTSDPAVIKTLTANAYLWGLGPEYVWRFSKYNTSIGAPYNALKYGAVPAAWNNEGTNAGNASVLYISGFVNFDAASELVLTVPPSRNQYYLVAYYDAYANSIGSIGTRTTPADTTTSYLLVGPNSPYANQQTVTIHGHEYAVMASDTTIGWFLIRVLANPLIAASDPRSVPSVSNGVVKTFALNTLQEFEQNGQRPVYPASYVLPPPTPQQLQEAAPYQNAPADAVEFFTQLGTAVATSPIPNVGTGLSGTPLSALPAWVAPQYGADTIYRVPSYGQQATLDNFSPIGLTGQGFVIPANWGNAQLQALQEGFELGQQTLDGVIAEALAGPTTNYWAILNDMVGTYPNTMVGYIARSVIVIEGGVANLPLDAIYPTVVGDPTPLDGNQTYQLTFTPPTSDLPAVGIYPPMVSDSSGNPRGFWSINLYAPDPTQSAAPFIAQTGVLNTYYSTADTSVLAVDPATASVTVRTPTWGTLVQSTPILFGANAAAYGLTPNTVYYVATVPALNADTTEYTFQISAQWLQNLSPGNVPIQGQGGRAGPIIPLQSPGGPVTLTYGMVKPVTQLGSSQLAANQLVKNADGSLTLWFGPRLPAGAAASNWIPTPSTAYYSTLYPNTPVSTVFQLTLRMYYPTPGTKPPSILPCSASTCGQDLQESYIPAAVALVPGMVTSVTVSPAQPVVGASATISVGGTNPCGVVGLSYDGGGEEMHSITSLPYTSAHIFSTAGTHLVTATGHGNCNGRVDMTVTVPVSRPYMSLDGPANNSTIQQPFNTGGWAVDLGATTGSGVDAIHVWAFPVVNGVVGSGQFVAAAQLGGSRPDVGAVFGSQFDNAGFNCLATGLSPGQYYVGAYAHSTVTGTFNQQQFAFVTIR